MTDKWGTLEQRLRNFRQAVHARAGGHNLTFIRTIANDRLMTAVYVEDVIDGPWFKVDSAGRPIHREGRFWRPVRRREFPITQHDKLRRVFGKKRAAEMVALKTIHLTPYWSSNSNLIDHLKENFPDLELVDKSTEAENA